MKKYYTSMSPDSARHILLDSEDEAIKEARIKVSEDGRRRYVCKIIYIVEPEMAPVRITKVE